MRRRAGLLLLLLTTGCALPGQGPVGALPPGDEVVQEQSGDCAGVSAQECLVEDARLETVLEVREATARSDDDTARALTTSLAEDGFTAWRSRYGYSPPEESPPYVWCREPDQESPRDCLLLIGVTDEGHYALAHDEDGDSLEG